MNVSLELASAPSGILARLENLERQNRRMRLLSTAAVGGLAMAFAGGFQTPPAAANRRISADEIRCGTITAEAFVVSMDKGTIRLDRNGLVMTAPGDATGGRTNLVDHEARIEIGLDWEWKQENALSPTPRVLVGRVGHDTSNNLSTRASILSPEGCHSGEWHKNNPKHAGRTDRDLIDELRRR